MRSYDGAAKITASDMRLMDAAIILNGLVPAASRDLQFASGRLAVKGKRVADLLTRERYYFLRKFHHPGNPVTAKKKGDAGYDNLAQVTSAPIRRTFSLHTPNPSGATHTRQHIFLVCSAPMPAHCC